jgi:hypothetical protein
MRRALAASVLVTLLAPLAFAQTATGQPVRTVPTQPEIAAQATFDTGYLLAFYMMQLAAAGAPPSQADIDEATRQYLTNGAAVTSVPTSGPGAAYFHNGAEVMAFPSRSVAPAPDATVSAGAASVASEPYEEAAGIPPAPASGEEAPQAGTSAPQAAPASEIRAGSTGLTCAPLEIEAAMAIASQFATAAAPPPPATACPPTNASTPAPQRAEPAPPAVEQPATQCPAGPSAPSRLTPALGGALLGALAAALWSRSRPVRTTRTRDAR